MKLPNLAHLTKQQKLAAGGVAAAGAIVLGLKARNGGGAAAGTSGKAGAPQVVPASSGAAGASYDSTANDVYNSIQPQIEDLYGQLSQLANQPVAAPIQKILSPAPAVAVAPPQVTVAAPSPAATSIQQAYGPTFVNSYEGTGAAWAPPPMPGSISAPAGGTLRSGRWIDGVLVSGSYRMPDGSMVSK